MASTRTLSVFTTILLITGLGALVTIAQTGYGGSLQTPSDVILHSVCGDTTSGLLLAVGTDGKNGVIYRITSLDTSDPSYMVLLQNSTPSSGYDNLGFYACEVVDNYLFVVGEVEKKEPRTTQIHGYVVIYSINANGTLTYLYYKVKGSGTSSVYSYKDIEVRKIGDRYYMYMLSILGSNVHFHYAVFIPPNQVEGDTVYVNLTCSGCNGYEISLYGDYLGVLYRDSSNNLNLTIYDVTNGVPTTLQSVTLVSGRNVY